MILDNTTQDYLSNKLRTIDSDKFTTEITKIVKFCEGGMDIWI